ncbi:MAG: hypothetical protein JHC31_05565 [Sulfurihydrogenibium sp.]|jgi:hypothetical protein|nr:hypothetical protein [Sulfurihydrogenibium sp.]
MKSFTVTFAERFFVPLVVGVLEVYSSSGGSVSHCDGIFVYRTGSKDVTIHLVNPVDSTGFVEISMDADYCDDDFDLLWYDLLLTFEFVSRDVLKISQALMDREDYCLLDESFPDVFIDIRRYDEDPVSVSIKHPCCDCITINVKVVEY